MKSILRRRPSPALVISMIALFVSLSGVSYGVATGFIDSREIKNNEIRSLDIRNNEVRTRDLRNNEVRGIDIRNSTVQGRDIALNTVTGEDIEREHARQGAERDGGRHARPPPASVRTPEDHSADQRRRGRSPVTLATHGPLDARRALRRGAAAPAEGPDWTSRPRPDVTTRRRAGRTPPISSRTSMPRMALRDRQRRPAWPAAARGSTSVASAPSGKAIQRPGRAVRDATAPAPAASTGAGASRARPRRRPAGPSGAASGGRRRTRRCRRAGGPGAGRSP